MSSHRSSARWSVIAVACLIASALFPAFHPVVSRAQTTPATVPSQLAGTWAFDGARSRAIQIVDAAFAPVIATLPELLQGLARDRIRSDMSPPHHATVALDGPRISVTLESDRHKVIAGALGSPATTTGVASGTRVTPRLAGGWLEIAYEGEGSVLRQLFSTEPDGSRMHVDYTITGERLSSPVRYRLDFVHQ